MSQSSEFIRAVLAGWWVSPFVGGGVVGEVFELVWHRGWEGRGTRRRRMTVAGKWHALWKAVWVAPGWFGVERRRERKRTRERNRQQQQQQSTNNNNQLLMHALTHPKADGDGFG